MKNLHQAELAVIKFCQGKRFPKELINLGKEQPVKKSCHLHMPTAARWNQKVGHGGHNNVLSKLRKRYWIAVQPSGEY